MKKIFAILLSLALVVSLGAIAAPVAATTMPSVSPTSGTYNMDTEVDVTTTIKWGDATSLSITDNEGTSLTAGVGNDYVVYGSAPDDALLVITSLYLNGVLTYVGDSITLILSFDVGITTFTITATGTGPAVSPASANWVYGSGDAVTFNIIWGSATSVASISGLSGGAGTAYDVFGDVLVIYPGGVGDLADDLDGVGDYVTYVVVFNTAATAAFTIVATGDSPTISPTSANWVLASTDVVTTTITFNSATSLNDIDDSDGYTLVAGAGNDYILFGTLVVILPDYLDTVLTSADDSIVLTLTFDLGTVLFTISATGLDVPSVSPESATWELGNCDDDVSTTITWAGADTISIQDVTVATAPIDLVEDLDYSLSGNTLTFFACLNTTARATSDWDGLECVLDADVHQTRFMEITFNDDDSTVVDFLISTTGFVAPSLSSTALTYDLDMADDPLLVYVGALITWGDATGIEYIEQLDPDTGLGACNLSDAANYMVAYNAAYGGWLVLFLKDYYLKKTNPWICAALPGPIYIYCCGAELQEIGDEVSVVIHWSPMNETCGVGGAGTPYDDKFPATKVTITAVGTSASMSPSSGEFNIDDPGNVTVEVDWGPHAQGIDGITVGTDALTVDEDFYWDAYVDADTTSTLIIDAEYLEDVLEDVGDSIVLDVDFDTGEDGKLTITAVGTPLCFIATAAGADAPQLDILREFRDEVLRPNAPWLVSLYYEVSPPIANVIAGNEALKKLVMDLVVEPAVFIAGKVMD